MNITHIDIYLTPNSSILVYHVYNFIINVWLDILFNKTSKLREKISFYDIRLPD